MELVMVWEAWHAASWGCKSQTWLSNWTELNWLQNIVIWYISMHFKMTTIISLDITFNQLLVYFSKIAVLNNTNISVFLQYFKFQIS